MKKNCDGCRASFYDRPFFTCQLDYKIDANSGKPLANCPKPRTNKRLMELNLLKTKYDLTLDELAKWKF